MSQRMVVIVAGAALALMGAGQAHAQKGGRGPREAQSIYYGGANVSLNIRKGAYELDAAKLRQDTACENLVLFGAALGKRYALGPSARLKLGAIFNFGTVVEDTLQIDYGEYLAVKQSFLQIGIDPEIQFPLSRTGNVTPFVCAGGGFDFVRFQDGFAYVDDPRQWVEFRAEDNMATRVERRWCPHAQAGAGFDFMPRKEVGLCVAYSFRFSKPVAYSDSRDLPLSGVSYREFFFSHMVQIQVLFVLED